MRAAIYSPDGAERVEGRGTLRRRRPRGSKEARGGSPGALLARHPRVFLGRGMMRIVAIRPEPGLGATLAAGAARGLTIEGWPLFEIRPVAWELPAAEGIDGLLIGSANAVRHAGPGLAQFETVPAFCVGKATADAARAAGLSVSATGDGGLQHLIDSIEGLPLRLLRLAGETHVTLTLRPGITLETRIVYRAEPLRMPAMLAEELRDGALVLLHSANAAHHFSLECDRLSIPRQNIALIALGPRIADAAGDGWASLRSAGDPSDTALLALAADMCH